MDGYSLHDIRTAPGEMEKEVFCAHGTMHGYLEKFYKNSDNSKVPICMNCGCCAILNAESVYKCKHCINTSDLRIIESTWSAPKFMEGFKTIHELEKETQTLKFE